MVFVGGAGTTHVLCFAVATHVYHCCFYVQAAAREAARQQRAAREADAEKRRRAAQRRELRTRHAAVVMSEQQRALVEGVLASAQVLVQGGHDLDDEEDAAKLQLELRSLGVFALLFLCFAQLFNNAHTCFPIQALQSITLQQQQQRMPLTAWLLRLSGCV